MIALVVAVVLTLGVPAAASAATVSVEPYAEPPGTDPYGSCSRYMTCPPDMVVVTGGPNENNAVAIAADGTVPVEGTWTTRHRFVVTDRIAQVQAGPGCSQVDFRSVSCMAGAVGPVRLGDGNDWFASALGATQVDGGSGQDVIQDVLGGHLTGGEGDDLIVGQDGSGGRGDDMLAVISGDGGAGDDIVRCFPRVAACKLDGGPGDDLLIGGRSDDRLLGAGGDDRLAGGAGGDRLVGGAGVDALASREDRSAGQRTALDRVDCGRGRRDRAVADRGDEVRRSCERVVYPG